MNTNTSNSMYPIAEQTQNNSTGWVGDLPGTDNHIVRGQTFVANAEGDVQTIQLFSNMVKDPGKVVLTLHTYDPLKKTWGPVLATSTVEFNKNDSGKWITFNIPSLHLDKGKTYGFKIDTTSSLIGIGETAASAGTPLSSGCEEWKFTGNNSGDSYSYFSLAYKVAC